jgi:hypothetical protein
MPRTAHGMPSVSYDIAPSGPVPVVHSSETRDNAEDGRMGLNAERIDPPVKDAGQRRPQMGAAGRRQCDLRPPRVGDDRAPSVGTAAAGALHRRSIIGRTR